MNLVALESSTHRLSVALWRNGAVAERCEEIPNAGSQFLLPWLGELIAQAGVSVSDVDAVAFASGPGGFVGLRLACALAQGLSIGLDVPVVAVGTLEALAVASGGVDVYACLDARMGEVYAGAYRVSGDAVAVMAAPGVFRPDAVPVPPPGQWLGAGDGFRVGGAALRGRLGEAVLEIRDDCTPSAAAVARIGAARMLAGGGGDAGSALPFYVRDSVALTTQERLARGGKR